MTPSRAAAFAARIVGLVTLVWVYLGYHDLLDLIRQRKAHLMIMGEKYTYNYPVFRGLTWLYLAIPIVAALLLLVIPGKTLALLTPAKIKPRSLNIFWYGVFIALGLTTTLFGLHTLISSIKDTIFFSGRTPGWPMQLAEWTLFVVIGLVLCRYVLAQRGEKIIRSK